MCSWLDTDLYINFVYHTVVIFVMETLVNRPYEPVHSPGIHEYHELTCVCLPSQLVVLNSRCMNGL